ncbi:porin [Undibacterium sp. TS12]|uniref:porin n=1 Tax=Undibacterium sp. TS12 TaxID=2908202 RepID=UPI001F4C8B57|nr:porin [Undibacterium sp. TS12]MCH8623033.1 porin [Undibacterium sp. TS12]
MFKPSYLIALLGASGSAFAQSVVTPYGIADLGVHYSTGINANNAPVASGSTAALSSGINNTSRWGLKGQEALGDGMEAVFQFEGGLNIDTGASAKSDKLFDRLAFVCIKSSYGSLTAGRQATILSDAISLVDPLGMRYASFNPNINVTALSNTAFGSHAFGVQYGTSGYADNYYRLDNMLKYTGEFGPLVARVSYSFGEVAGNSSALSTMGAGLAYQQDGLSVSGAYMKFKNSADFGLQAYTLGAAYQFGSVQLKANVGSNRADTSSTRQTHQRIASVGAAFSVGPDLTLTTAYYRVRREANGFVDDGFDRSFAYLEKALSKRSTVYIETDYTAWKGNAAGITGSQANSSNGFGLTLGLMHKF